MNNKELIMVAYHEESRDDNGKLVTPASLFKLYKDNDKDCFGEKYIASCEQIYARPNKKLNGKVLNIDDFKGKKGIQERFYDMDSLYEFIEILVEDGYNLKRIPRHNEDEMADNLFKHMMHYSMSRVSKVMNF